MNLLTKGHMLRINELSSISTAKAMLEMNNFVNCQRMFVLCVKYFKILL